MSSSFERLVEYIQFLRSSDQGCPWTKSQDFASLLPQTIDECVEMLQALQQGNMKEFDEELSDLLYHLAFYCVIAQEQNGLSTEEDLSIRADAIIKKHETRLPPAEKRAEFTPESINIYWQEKKGVRVKESIFAEMQASFPALHFAVKCQSKAASVGFDWSNAEEVLDKLDEESRELHDAVKQKTSQEVIQDEIGDMLFTLVNIARHCNIDPEVALHHANQKFMRRFKHVEKLAKEKNIALSEADLENLEALWNEAKTAG